MSERRGLLANRYLWFGALALLVLVLDLGSKHWADSWLASPKTREEFPSHPVKLVVEPEDAGTPLKGYLSEVLSWSRSEEIDRILARSLVIDGKRGPHDPEAPVAAGQKLTLLVREVVVHDSFWRFRFVRNPAAAWGFLGGLPHSTRLPVFYVVSIISILLILYIFVSSPPEQRLLAGALAAILGGAVGNLVDRIRFGFVIDFIDWYITWGGKERHWPTFNIADAGITVGVILLAIEVLRGQRARKGEGDAADAETDAAPGA